MAKCVSKGMTIMRVKNSHAARLVATEGYHYISKGSYRHQLKENKRNKEE